MKRIGKRLDQEFRLEAALSGVKLPEREAELSSLELSQEQEDLANKAMQAAIERKRAEMKHV